MDEIDKRYEDIPQYLKDLNIWLCYDDINYSGDDAKKPRHPYTDKTASINNRLFSFDECINAIKKGVCSGLGIVLKKKSGLLCIDYDKVIEGYKSIDKLGIEIPIYKKDASDRINRDINLLKGYTEISPSGKGIHIYLLATNDINTKNDLIEVYNNHFIRVSGNSLNIDYDFTDKTDEVNKLIDLYKLDASNNKNINLYKYKGSYYNDMLDKKFTKNNIRYQNQYTDKQILDTMFNSKNGKYIQRLYYGIITDDELRDYKGASDIDTSNSGKSITLIMYLLHFSYGDLKAVKRLFINSGLIKPSYLKLKYNNNTMDKIDNQFIPKAITYYNNYSDELLKIK